MNRRAFTQIAAGGLVSAVALDRLDVAPASAFPRAPRIVTGAPDYTMAVLPTGGQKAGAVAINNRGVVAGTVSTTKLGDQYPLLWRPDGTVTALRTQFLAWEFARGLNDAGEVVGAVTGPMQRAVAWHGGLPVDLGALGGDRSEAIGINTAGQIVGWAETSDGARHAFLWSRGRMIDLGTLGGASSTAMAINDAGQVVGWSETAAGNEHAFIWQSGAMHDLGTFGGWQSHAFAVNNAGQITGWAETAKAAPRPCIWQAGTMRDLGTLGGERGIAFDINARGQIVGEAAGADKTWHPVLWDAGHVIDLVPGEQDSHALGINDAGVIAGSVRRGPGSYLPVIWTPVAGAGRS